ncbi:MAG: AAA family ATPase [bacterium]|nr:AAA family ATPase [bacterium]
MDYFRILNLNKEPFSNSPDPEFFFHSRRHLDCLQKLELSLLLRRGLNVIIGDVGTGKTTLCRQLIRRFSQKSETETHLILDPHFLNASEFLTTVTEIVTGKKPAPGSNELQIKEKIKQYLFRKGVDEKKIVVLIIDEGQKIPAFCLEILREFLNYETNEYKLLQIVIFGQKEFEGTVRKYPNFGDRINLYHTLEPLNFRDTRLMIKYRLEKSSQHPQKMSLFSLPALWAIYRISGGYPRKIINLCHQSILAMIIQNRLKSGYFLVNTCARRVFPEESNRRRLVRVGAMAVTAVAVALLILLSVDRFSSIRDQGMNRLSALLAGESNQGISLADAESKPRTFRARIAPADLSRRQPAENELARSFKTNKPARPAKSAQSAQPHTITEPVPSEGPLDEKATTDGKDVLNVSVSPRGELPIVKKSPASVEMAPGNVGAEKTPAATYSAILGQLILEPNETLSRIIRGVYGHFSSKYFKSIITANPGIVDPDRVDVGQIISLPAIPALVKPLNISVWWIKLDDRDSLEAAFNLVRKRSNSLPDVRLIPHWNPSDGTRFAVVLNKLFKNEYAARNYLQRLPRELALKSTIFSRWDNETIYFANPYHK